jgi:hypothetical protein
MTSKTDDTHVRLGVRLEFGADTIRGTVEEPGGAEFEFNGWLALMSAFDSACLRARRMAQARDQSDNEGSQCSP